jgi:hypothetical protein
VPCPPFIACGKPVKIRFLPRKSANFSVGTKGCPDGKLSGVERRLDDRVRQLCAAAVASQSGDELAEICSQLRTDIRELLARVRSRVKFPIAERRLAQEDSPCGKRAKN